MKVPQEELKQKLTPEQYHVICEKGTEAPFSGKLEAEERDGMYYCVACGNQLFASGTKFHSGSGWPSFNDVVNSDAVETADDYSFGMHRTEVTCAKCGGHLGHLFPDNDQPTGAYYCINSAALNFKPTQDSSHE